MSNWTHKDEWKMTGKDFIVQVSRHSATPSEYDLSEGVNRWAVYAYIYPRHPHFASFTGDDMNQDAACMMPLHCGPSFFRRHIGDDGKTCSVQVGADYHHLYDSRFTHHATKEDAGEVFGDAENLHVWLSERSV